MVGTEFHSPGYHSQVAEGTWVHPTRRSLHYAVALLERNEPGDADRAEKIIRKVLTLQDTNPENATYGIWPWLMEESLEEMAPPDWNWADFLGSMLALALVEYPDRVDDDLEEAMRESLGHAARAIRKRNVRPSYTNIAIMGGGVCAAAGELLDDPAMLKYGRERLEDCVAHAEYHGSFNEYNSPTYTRVALFETERVLQLVKDPASRRAAEQLRQVAWQVIADSFHPGTGQWAGPHSRAYSNTLGDRIVRFLREQTGVPLAPYVDLSGPTNSSSYDLVRHLPCPEHLKERFQSLTTDPLCLKRTFIRKDPPSRNTIGTTWHTAEMCLGSINRSSFWTQRRVMIGYWKTEKDPVVVFRMRFLHDGRDFASMGVLNDQEGGKVLSMIHPIPNRGDWHIHLDRPKDGIFQAEDFRLRLELIGEGVEVEALGAGRFAMIGGDHRAVIHTLPGEFNGEPIVWEMGEEGDRVYLDAVCYRGPNKEFNFRKGPPMKLLLATELLPGGKGVTTCSPIVELNEQGKIVEASWEVPNQETLSITP
jgi:hypothetical protein